MSKPRALSSPYRGEGGEHLTVLMAKNYCSNKEQWLQYLLHREQSRQTEDHLWQLIC